MDYVNLLRAFIFLTAGIPVLLFPNGMLRSQIYMLEKLHIKNRWGVNKRGNNIFAIIVLIISAFLFFFSSIDWNI